MRGLHIGYMKGVIKRVYIVHNEGVTHWVDEGFRVWGVIKRVYIVHNEGVTHRVYKGFRVWGLS